MTEMKHTPTPWKYSPYHFKNAQGSIFMEKANGACTIQLTGAASMTQKQLNNNAAFIVRAVNAHDALVKVIGASLEALDKADLSELATILDFNGRAALAQAKGK